jgi:transposase
VVGAAAILAKTGDPPALMTPRRWSSTPAWARATTPRVPCRQDHHLGSGSAAAAAGRLAGGVGALPHTPVFAARYAHLTSRQHNRLSDGQARSAVAAALLRQLWVVCVNRTPWELAVAGGTIRKEVTDPAA